MRPCRGEDTALLFSFCPFLVSASGPKTRLSNHGLFFPQWKMLYSLSMSCLPPLGIMKSHIVLAPSKSAVNYQTPSHLSQGSREFPAWWDTSPILECKLPRTVRGLGAPDPVS